MDDCLPLLLLEMCWVDQSPVHISILFKLFLQEMLFIYLLLQECIILALQVRHELRDEHFLVQLRVILKDLLHQLIIVFFLVGIRLLMLLLVVHEDFWFLDL